MGGPLFRSALGLLPALFVWAIALVALAALYHCHCSAAEAALAASHLLGPSKFY